MSTPKCPHCQTPQPALESALQTVCDHCQAMIFHPTNGPRVLVALRDDALARHMGETLLGAQFNVIRAVDGVAVLKLLEQVHVDALVLDVALEEITAFRVVEEVRAKSEWAHVRVILMASVYSKTAYKRRPTSLYGADDYLEQHHIHDMLVPKLLALLHTAKPTHVYAPANAPRPLSELLRVQALAYSIVSDIALYHQAEVEAAIAGASPSNLQAALDEGRRLLVSMVAPRDGESRDPIGDAFIAFVDDMRRMMR